MKFYKLQCPNCGANLEVEDELDSFFCKYCGTKIFIADQHPEIVKAKAAVHIADTNVELEKIRLQHELDLKKFEEEKEHRDAIFVFKVLGVLFAGFFIAIGIISFFVN